MSKVISGRGKINFTKDKDKEKMEKKYPDVEFEKMNPLTFTTTYKGNEMFDLKIKVGDTEIPCSFKKWAEPWKYGSKLALTPHFKDLGKKAIFSVSGGIQGKLFQFFRYDYEKMLGKKKGGGKNVRVKPEEFKKMISEMEGSAMKENQKCNTSCYKIKTNHAKDKKKLQLKRKCHQGCEKKRMKTVKAFHKKYPKEFKGFVKNLGGGGSKKETKYICYDGIGSNKTGTHTEKEFLQVMKKNKDNFNENPPKNIKTADQWMKWAGAEKGRCKTKKQPVKLTDKQIRKKCRKSCNKGRKELTKSLKAMDKILKVKNFKELNKKSLKMYDKTCVKTCVDIAKDPKKMKQSLNEIKEIQGKMNEGKLKISL